MNLSILWKRAKSIRLHRVFSLAIMPGLVLLSAMAANAQTSTLTYQGRLNDGGTAATGNYDLQFALWDSLSGGAQIGSTLTISTVAVNNGTFTVTLDFGAGDNLT